jgi:hypothetical protein
MASPEQLKHILAQLLWSRVKAEDAPCASDQHWCSAIEALSKLIPEYVPTDPEELYELKYALLNQEVLFGRMSADDAIAELDKYEEAAQAASFVPPQFREQFKRPNGLNP